MIFLKSLVFVVILACACFPFLSFASVANQNPYETANEIARQTFADLKSNKNQLSDNKVVIEIINRDLMPHLDVKYAAYKVIGKSLEKTSKEEREAFSSAFGDYLVRSISSALGKYSNQEIVESPVQDVSSDITIVPVKYVVTSKGNPDVNFIVKMRLNKKTGEWKAFDLIAENISILDAKQAELSPIIREKGIKEAINVLQESNGK